ncbi:MAG: hypothetical protein AB7G47_12690 [Mycolicibacterium sp.]|uniref:hypothetical protein n=1 Tax=Mycolicibacterium sp. TaxID=2320850 RepID=UPI003D12F69D
MTMNANKSRPLARPTIVLGGLVAGTMLMLSAPGAGIAQAHEGNPTDSGQAVGRDGFDNPAPGVRLTQAFGDNLFNERTPFNKALNESPMGQSYHRLYGTPNYEDHIHGSNGTRVGLLNSPGFRELYDGLQDSGWRLPGEADLPGTAVRRVSGVKPGTGSGHGHGHGEEDDADDHGVHALADEDTSMSASGECAGDSLQKAALSADSGCDPNGH